MCPTVLFLDFLFWSYQGNVTKYIYLIVAGTCIFLVLLVNFIYITVALCIWPAHLAWMSFVARLFWHWVSVKAQSCVCGAGAGESKLLLLSFGQKETSGQLVCKLTVGGECMPPLWLLCILCCLVTHSWFPVFCYNPDKSSVLFATLTAVRISSIKYFYIYIFYDKDCCWFTDTEDLVCVHPPSPLLRVSFVSILLPLETCCPPLTCLILLDAVFPQSPSAEPSVVPNAITSFLLNDIHYKNCFFHRSCGF